MTEAHALPFETGTEHPHSATPVARLSVAGERARYVEVIAPDPYCAGLLLAEVAKAFPAEILLGSGSIVRLHPPAGQEWVLELLSLVERWLDSIPLPCTKMFYGGRSYLLRASTGIALHPAAAVAAMSADETSGTPSPSPSPSLAWAERTERAS